MKLYEITAMVSYSIVIAAESKEDAMAHIKSWEKAWPENAEFVAVSDVDLLDERDMTGDDWRDEAHDITSKALMADIMNSEHE